MHSMETADKQTNEIEKQNSHAVGCGNNKTSDNQGERSNGPPKLGSCNTKWKLSSPWNLSCSRQKVNELWKLNHFAKVCRIKSINCLKLTRSRKPSKGKHRARLMDSKCPSDDEALTPATAESDCWGKFFSFCFSFSHLLVIVYSFSFRSGISLITLLCYVLYVNFVIVYYLALILLPVFTELLV